MFYRVVSAGGVPKDDAGYKAIGRQLVKLRRAGVVDYSDIADGTRWITRPDTYNSVEDALRETARLYRRALWSHSVHRVQIFSEKDAISGVILPITSRWDVPLGVLRGDVSDTFAWSVAQSLDPRHHHVIVQLGDHDPSGVSAWRTFIRKVQELTSATDVEFIRLAVTAPQIETLNLPTRPPKEKDGKAKGWVGGCVEVDAIPPRVLRFMLDEFISSYVDQHELDVLRVAEADERDVLRRLAGAA